MFTEEELNWIRTILSDYDPFQISSDYFHMKKIEAERYNNREIVRKELDDLINNTPFFTPKELLELNSKTERKRKGIEDCSGIYIIQNCVQNKYYIGQSEKVYERSCMHFISGKGNDEVFDDYIYDEEFCISLIPLSSTKFSTLNELEGSAIVAYNTLYPHGYNKIAGNIFDKPLYDNSEYQQVSDLILHRIKEIDEFPTLTNDRKRLAYIVKLFKEFEIPHNTGFYLNFKTAIKEYQKSIKDKLKNR